MNVVASGQQAGLVHPTISIPPMCSGSAGQKMRTAAIGGLQALADQPRSSGTLRGD